MIEYKKQIMDVIKEGIYDQMWFDYAKQTYPNEFVAACEYISRTFKTKRVNPLESLRFLDIKFKICAGGEKFLKGYFDYGKNLDFPIDLSSLSCEEVLKLDFAIWAFHEDEHPEIEGSLTDILVKELNEIRGMVPVGAQRG